MWPFTASKRQTVRALMRTIDQIESDLYLERQINSSLTQSLIVVSNPLNAELVQNVIDAARDADAEIVVAPDGEYIAPEAYDWERLAHEILDNEQGGASGSWE